MNRRSFLKGLAALLASPIVASLPAPVVKAAEDLLSSKTELSHVAFGIVSGEVERSGIWVEAHEIKLDGSKIKWEQTGEVFKVIETSPLRATQRVALMHVCDDYWIPIAASCP